MHGYVVDKLGLKLDHFTEELRAREPTAAEIDSLQLRSGECVIRLLRTVYDLDGQPVQVSDHRFAADKYVLLYDVPAD